MQYTITGFHGKQKWGFTKKRSPLVGNQSNGNYDLFTVGQTTFHASGFISYSKPQTKYSRSTCIYPIKIQYRQNGR